MRHGGEVMVAAAPLSKRGTRPCRAGDGAGTPPRFESDPLWLGLSMPIGLYRYLYPCRCAGGLCKCEAGS